MSTAAEATSRNFEGPPVPRHGQGHVSVNNASVRPRPQKANSGALAGLRRSAALSSRRESSSWQDEDAKLVMDSVSANRKSANLSNTLSSHRDQSGEKNSDQSAYLHVQSNKMDSLYGSNFQGKQRSTVTPVNGNDQDFQVPALKLESSDSTPRAKQRDLLQPTEPSLFDSFLPVPSTQHDSHHHHSGSNSSRSDGQPKKVMTRAQFERYRKEQENTEETSTSDVSDDENDNYDDDDEAERNRQVAKQRRKQEAHLAVYRQQMKKVTGEQPSELPNIGQLRSGPERITTGTPDRTSTSTPTFSFDKASGNSKGGSDDEDEDIPLGILAAHGFPTKNRPPTALGAAAANPYIRYTSESYPAPPMSTAGGSVAGGGKTLPPFARNLPQDPYYGAGLVNQSNRESLSFGSGGGSAYGGYSPNPNPGGLVGVIAGEERARALRRGSPNAQGSYTAPLPQSMPQMQAGMQPGMWPMQTMPTGNDPQSQMIAQMMQMNMQLMQSVQHLTGGAAQVPQPGVPLSFGPSPQQQMMNGFLSAPGQISRPTSMDSQSASGSQGLGQQGQQRAMSMMGSINGSLWPSKANQRMTMISGSSMGNQGYAPSIAPSERSNIGMPSRYRPVSIAPADEAPRSRLRESSFISGPSHLDSKDRRGSLMTTSIRPVQKSPSPPKLSTVSDDDDDEGWEQMKQKREQKKSSWKSKKKDEPNIDFIQFSEN